jgi:hypothetical protein
MKKFSFLEKLPRIVFTGKVQKEVQLEKSLTMKLPTELAIFVINQITKFHLLNEIGSNFVIEQKRHIYSIVANFFPTSTYFHFIKRGFNQ